MGAKAWKAWKALESLKAGLQTREEVVPASRGRPADLSCP